MDETDCCNNDLLHQTTDIVRDQTVQLRTFRERALPCGVTTSVSLRDEHYKIRVVADTNKMVRHGSPLNASGVSYKRP